MVAVIIAEAVLAMANKRQRRASPAALGFGVRSIV
jgi:hypothetical protein